MFKGYISNWNALTKQEQQIILENTAKTLAIPTAEAVEKDWWVLRTLLIVFTSSIGKYVIFKGVTSLSKAWHLINRFSEDIDLALDRKYLGITVADEDITNAQLRKIRRLSCSFVRDTYL